MRSFLSLSGRAIERFSSVLVRIAMWGVFAMMVLVVVDVGLRTFAGMSLLLTEEVSGYLLVLVAYLAFAEALKQGRHVRVDLLITFLPDRLRARLDLILSLLGLTAMIVVTWRSIIMVYRSYIRDVRIPGILLTPVYLPQIIMVVGVLALVLQFLVEINKMAHTPQEPLKTEPAEIEKEVNDP